MASSKRSLPIELIEEILNRTPAESLNRFKWTCKQWYDLITDKRFMYNHLDRSPQRFISFYDDRMVQIMDPVTGNLSFPDMFYHPYLIAPMVHCDGLMLCMCRDSFVTFVKQTSHTLAVWNPVTRKIKWIEPLVSYSETDYFGFGYDNTCRHNYKILRFSGPVSLDDPPQCELYEFKSDSWRTLGAKFDWNVDTQCKGVSVKGNMYWIARRNEKEDFILSFDFSMETFKAIRVCPCYKQDMYVWVSYCGRTRSLGCFSGDRLSVILQHGTRKAESEGIEVFVTNKLSDRVVSFSKYFSVTSPPLPELQCYYDKAYPGHCIGKHNSIMAWCRVITHRGDER